MPAEPNASISTDYESASEGSGKKSPGKDVVMCRMIEITLSEEQESNWKPPPVTQELTYSLDDEIVSNPKACFVPRSVAQHKCSQLEEVTIVPCFPVSGRNRSLKEKTTQYDRPETYRTISSWLPASQGQLDTIATRPSVDTRLKMSARQRIEDDMGVSDEEGHCSTWSSSSSLEARSHHIMIHLLHLSCQAKKVN